tara:strand:+ start:2383 stop:2769 length:387 start_codon:yes stop_codon:yes gene_type:complete
MKKNIRIGSNRSFGIVFFIVFFIIGLWPLLNENEVRIWAVLISLVFLILGILNSKILTPLNKVWFKFGIFLGNFVAPIVMGFIYFLVVTPTGILVRVFKKDLLNLKKSKERTYWIEKNGKNNTMKNQF